MHAVVVYDDIKDKELLDSIDLGVPFFIDYVYARTLKGKKEAYRIKGPWSAQLNPFIELYDENDKIIKVFYSEIGNACNQLIAFLKNENQTCK